MGEWKATKLKNAPFAVIDGDRGQNYPSQSEFHSSGHCLFLSAKNVRKNGFDFSEKQFISEERDRALSKGKLQRNDIVLTTRGTVGNLAFYSEDVPFENVRINSGMVIVRPKLDEMKPEFCFYLFRALQQNQFEIFSSGSAQPQLPIRDMNEIDLLIPDLPEQKAIAEVLNSLDDKIDLLNRQNKTLESLTQTLFRQWFIDTIRFPVCFTGDCQFIGFSALLLMNPIPATLVFLIILAGAFWLRFNYKYAKGGSDLPRKIVDIEDIRFENLAFLATYLIPLIAFDPTKIRGAVMLVLVLAVIGWIFINTNTFYQNPALAILGYKLYRVDTETTKRRIVMSRDELEVNDYIYPRQISKNVDFAMREKR